MDKELIFYIIFGLIYLLSRIGRKKKKPKTPTPGQSPQQTTTRNQPAPRRTPPVSQGQRPSQKPQPVSEEEENPPMSFEDILKELAGEGRSKKQATPEPSAKPEPPVRKPLVSEPSPQPEPTYYVEEEQIDKEASDLWGAYKNESPAPAKPELSPKQVDYTDISSMQFDEYKMVDNSNPLTKEIREMLEDKEDVKKAIVLSEILNRRF